MPIDSIIYTVYDDMDEENYDLVLPIVSKAQISIFKIK